MAVQAVESGQFRYILRSRGKLVTGSHALFICQMRRLKRVNCCFFRLKMQRSIMKTYPDSPKTKTRCTKKLFSAEHKQQAIIVPAEGFIKT